MCKSVCSVLAIILLFVCSALYAQETEGGSFYYPMRYPHSSGDDSESAIIDDIRQEFAQAGRALPLSDRGLSFAARQRAQLLAAMTPDQKKLESGRDSKSWLLEYGIGDDRNVAGFAAAESPEKLREIFGRWAAAQSRGGWTHLGVGVAEYDAQFTAVVILSYRSIDPAPIPMEMQFRRNLIVDGVIRNRSDFLVFLSHPDGSVYMQKPTRIASGAVSAEFKLRYKGTHTLQLVEVGEKGPLPVATMPINVEKASRSWTPPLDELRRVPFEELAPACLRWLNVLREKYLLPELKPDERLNAVAARLATEMAAGGSFAHESGGESPLDRIQRSGVRFARFGENLAHGADMASMIMKLWYSPSHRYNMLDGGFDLCGTGLARNDKGQLFMVQLFAESAARH